MHDEPVVTRNCVIAWALWGTTIVCLVLMFSPIPYPLHWGTAGCMLSAGAATVSIRGFFIRFAKREHQAFQQGRELGRCEGGTVHALR